MSNYSGNRFMFQLLTRLVARGATYAVLSAAPFLSTSILAQGTSGATLTAQDTSLLSELKANGYNADEVLQLQQLLQNSRKYAKEMGVDPLVKVEMTPLADGAAERLALISPELSKLASLPSKSVVQVVGVSTITPANVAQVIATVHSVPAEEIAAMYGADTARAAAAERTRARQKTGWLERNLARLSETDRLNACNQANTLLGNAAHLSTELARHIVTTALELHAPAPDYGANPTDAQKTVLAMVLANRPLNMVNSLAGMTAIAKPGTGYRAAGGELIRVTADGIRYSMAPTARIRQLAGLPQAWQSVTVQALSQLQAWQGRSSAYGKEMAALDKSIAEDKKVIAEDKKVIAEDKKVIAETRQHTFIIRTVDTVREKLVPLLASYLWADAKKQDSIRRDIAVQIKALREAEQTILKIEPLNEENRLQVIESIQRVKELYGLAKKTGVDPTR